MTTSPSRSSGTLLEALLDLVAQLALGVAALALLLGLADAEDRLEPGVERRGDLVSASARSVSPKCWRRSEWPSTTPSTSSSVSIGGADLAGERALRRLVHVLRVDLRRASRAPSRRARRSAVNGGADRDVDAVGASRRAAAAPATNASASATVLCIFQLPAISGVRGSSPATSTPGSVLPSISSSDAPPPVDRWVTRSARPNGVQRGGAVAAADDGRARRAGDGLGDRARPGGERLELERAHRAVPEDACPRRRSPRA